jgi:hypothetical protein
MSHLLRNLVGVGGVRNRDQHLDLQLLQVAGVLVTAEEVGVQLQAGNEKTVGIEL